MSTQLELNTQICSCAACTLQVQRAGPHTLQVQRCRTAHRGPHVQSPTRATRSDLFRRHRTSPPPVTIPYGPPLLRSKPWRVAPRPADAPQGRGGVMEESLCSGEWQAAPGSGYVRYEVCVVAASSSTLAPLLRIRDRVRSDASHNRPCTVREYLEPSKGQCAVQ